ncbi:proline dehydrogenase family protein [Natronolimnohabitans innermongolicus]|uniref:proline dehydrogenase n=1 Tax=Natronolimnohabitans innermongolicus JCM 12255 TaxID=1227499 RepID=L9WR07_9EURY|nr:proline dehydrogenase family protein [Natronolimnohabitans innermongolicus]ELY51626.1 proline dehydrogenase [Natronolimnohabitans innermongolicus JCM 12255]
MIPPIANRFVASETSAVALEHVRQLNDRNVAGILNLLGEHYETRPPVRADAAEYRALIRDIARSDLEATISVKPSQFGLDLGGDVFRETLADVVGVAADHGVFVWIDMEDHTTTDATLDAFEALAREHWGGERSASGHGANGAAGGIGVCVQANLRRTREDVERLADVPGKVRFVKGAYDEPADVAYQDADRIDREYRNLLEYAFNHYDDGIAVGSHDPEMIDYAIDRHEEHGTDFEIQMLMGVREDAQTDLAGEYPVYQYVPYGNRWKSYFYRRMTERTENIRFALRAIFGR